MTQRVNVTIGGTTHRATFTVNGAVQTLLTMLGVAPITFEANDYGDFEKVGTLERTLPTSDVQITSRPGDILLYNGNQVVIFYGSNTWDYTRLGRIDSLTADELKTFLKAGQGKVNITLSLPE
ncbi:MAG: hypothetical protein IJ527_07815 [Prevotella sp.]|nr:hypothetical protein [Prevotella sp.]